MSQGFLGYFKNFYQSLWLIHIKGQPEKKKNKVLSDAPPFLHLLFIT